MEKRFLDPLHEQLESAGVDTKAERRAIINRGTFLTIPEKWAPMVQGSNPDKVYLILDGTVSINRNSEKVAELGRGDLVGETSVANGSLRNATVVAETNLKVVHFQVDRWLDLLEEIPSLKDRAEELAAQRK